MVRWGMALGTPVLVLILTALLAAPTLARGPEPLPGASRVTAGETHTCADWWYGSSCWGENERGKLGNGTGYGLLLAPLAPPTIVPDAVLTPPEPMARPFASLDAGPTATCSIATGQAGTTAGEVWCWGQQPLGRVCFDSGIGGTPGAPGVVMRGPPGDDDGPYDCGLAPLAPVFLVAVAEHRTCALVGSPYGPRGGEVWCWDDVGGGRRLLAHPLPGPDGGTMAGVRFIDGAFDRFCGIIAEGDVWCWDDRSSDPPSPVAGLADAVAVAVGEDHACAQVRDGSVWCWGANDRGQLGDGSTDSADSADSAVRVVGLDETSPTEAGDPSDMAFPWWRSRRILGTGRAHTCVLRDDPDESYQREAEMSNAVFCWGANDRGQLGDGSRDDRSTPVRVVSLDSAEGVFDLALGGSYGCAVTGEQAMASAADPTLGGIGSSTTLRCWGANEHGQLGTGDRDDRSRPSIVVMTEEPRLEPSPD